MRTPLALALVALSLFLSLPAAAQPGGRRGPDPVTAFRPGPIDGRWWEGNLSTIQYYDPSTGTWSLPNGSGTWFDFHTDGTYTAGGVLNTGTGSCTTTLYVYTYGHYTTMGSVLTVNQTGGNSLARTCFGTQYERVLEAETKVYGWSRSGANLVLTRDGQPYATYRPWEGGGGPTPPTGEALRSYDPSQGQIISLLDEVAPLDSGFVYGSNRWNDLEKATLIRLPAGRTSAQLTDVAVYVAHRNMSAQHSFFHVDVYAGTEATGPTTLIGTVGRVFFSDIQADDNTSTPSPATLVHADTPITVPSTFFVSVRLSAADYPASANAIAIAATPIQNTRIPEVWERWADGTWANASDAWWGTGGQFGSGRSGGRLWIDAIVAGTTAVDDAPDAAANTLGQPIPNPVTGRAVLPVQLGAAETVRLSLYDLLGREVAVVHDGPLQSGRHELTWDAANLPAGVYVARLTTAAGTATRRLTVAH